MKKENEIKTSNLPIFALVCAGLLLYIGMYTEAVIVGAIAGGLIYYTKK